MLYGILKSNTNTGLNSELECVFSTPLSISSNQPAFVQDSLNLRRNAGSQNIQRWEIEANIAQTNNSAGYLVHSVSNGYVKVIYVRMPQVFGLSVTDVPVTAGNNKVFGDVIPAKSEYIAIAGADSLVPGEFIQFASSPKVHLVTEAGGSSRDVRIFPPVNVAVQSGTTIRTGGFVTLHASYDTDVQIGITFTDGVLSDPGSIRLVERL